MRLAIDPDGKAALIEGDAEELAVLAESLTLAAEDGEVVGRVLADDGVMPLTIRRTDG